MQVQIGHIQSLDWTGGLDRWTGLDWNGLDWTGLDCTISLAASTCIIVLCPDFGTRLLVLVLP